MTTASERRPGIGDVLLPWDKDVPTTGEGFLAFGLHEGDNLPCWRAGDLWWAIVLCDVWRPKTMGRFVFAKDGSRLWGTPTHYARLEIPRGEPDGVASSPPGWWT